MRYLASTNKPPINHKARREIQELTNQLMYYVGKGAQEERLKKTDDDREAVDPKTYQQRVKENMTAAERHKKEAEEKREAEIKGREMKMRRDDYEAKKAREQSDREAEEAQKKRDEAKEAEARKLDEEQERRRKELQEREEKEKEERAAALKANLKKADTAPAPKKTEPEPQADFRSVLKKTPSAAPAPKEEKVIPKDSPDLGVPTAPERKVII